MSSSVFPVLACLFFVGCGQQLPGEWEITAAGFGTGAGASSLSDLTGTVIIERDGSATLDLLSGDLEGDYLEIDLEGEAADSGDGDFSLVLTGSQEVPQNAFFIDLNLQCVSDEVDAECTGLWESLALDSQQMYVDLTVL